MPTGVTDDTIDLDDLLNSVTDEDSIDESVEFVIDENLRTIAVPPSSAIIGVVGDKKVNVINFTMARYYNGFDMSQFEIRINYANAKNELNYYLVTKPTIKDDTILFSWLVDSDATAYIGRVSFIVRLIKTDSDSNITQAFNTTLATAQVLDGLDVDGYITPEQQQDVLSRLKSDLSEWVTVGPLKKGSGANSVLQENTQYPNEASGHGAVALGAWNKVKNIYGFAQGWGNHVNGDKGVAIGKDNIIDNNTGFGLGRDNEVRGYGAIALGNNSIAVGDRSIAIGSGALAEEDDQIALGENNAPNQNAKLIIGGGDTDRCNLMTLQKDGSMTIGGHFEDATLRNESAVLAKYDALPSSNIVDLNADDNVIVYDGSLHGGNTAWKVTAQTNAGGIRPQMLVKIYEVVGLGSYQYKTLSLETGESYSISFKVYSETGFHLKYWFTADSSTSCYTQTSQKNAALIYETTDDIKIPANEWTTISCIVKDCPHSGYLRLGITAQEAYDNPPTIFWLDDIIVQRYSENRIVYNYKAYNGRSYSTTLYKIAECQTAKEQIEWLTGKTLKFLRYKDSWKEHTITREEIANSLTDQSGDGNNYFFAYNPSGSSKYSGTVVIVCVDWIVTDKIDCPERGIYVADCVDAVSYKKWVDEPYDTKKDSLDMGASMNNLLTMLGSQLGGTINKTWDDTTKAWTFTFSATDSGAGHTDDTYDVSNSSNG